MLGASAKAVEGTEDHVFLVGSSPWGIAQLLLREVDEAGVKPFPEDLRCSSVARLQRAQTLTD